MNEFMHSLLEQPGTQDFHCPRGNRKLAPGDDLYLVDISIDMWKCSNIMLIWSIPARQATHMCILHGTPLFIFAGLGSYPGIDCLSCVCNEDCARNG